MSILCGTDLTERSLPAQKVALALASRLGEHEVWLLHVINPGDYASPFLFEHARRAALGNLDALATSLRVGSDLHLYPQVLIGSLPRVLHEFAHLRRVRLVVLSSPGHAGEPLYPWGGSTERVGQTAGVPVLVVRGAEPFLAWARGERPLRVLVGVDEARSASGALALTRILAASGGVEVTAAHLYPAPSRRARHGVPSAAWLHPSPQLEAWVARDLARWVGPVPGAKAVDVLARPALGRIGEGLLELAAERGAGLVITGTHGKRGLSRLGSVSAEVLHYGKPSVLLAPPLPARAVPEVRRVLVGVDLTEDSLEVVRHAVSVLGGAGEIHLVHVRPPGSALDDEGLRSRLRELIPPETSSGIHWELHVLGGDDVAGALHQAADWVGAELLCVASHQHGRTIPAALGPVAEAVLHAGHLPVLVVHPGQG